MEVNSSGILGRTPLAFAVEEGHESIVELLLRAHAVDVNAADISGLTSLMLAVREGHELVVHRLLECAAFPRLAVTSKGAVH